MARGLLFCALLLAGCSSGGASAQTGDGGVSDATTDGPAGDGGAGDAQGSPEGGGDVEAGGPVITGMAITGNVNSVLSATLTFTTDRPAVGSVHGVNTTAPDNVFDAPAEATPSTTHKLWLLGMRAGSTFDLTVSATAGGTSTATTTYKTGALPDDVPPLTVVMNDKTRTSPGYMLLDVQEFTGNPVAGPDGARGSYILGLDADLQIVWYHRGAVTDPERLPNGDLVFLDAAGWTEIDMLGDTVRTHAPTQRGVDTLTHALQPEASGALLSLAPELRLVPGFRAPDGGTQTLPIVGDRVLELPTDGGPATVLADTFDLFDPLTSVGPANLFDVGEWNYLYPHAGATKDWMHANSVVADPTDDTIVTSSHTISWIFKTDRQGKLLWRLGPGGDFTMSDARVGTGFQYNQHGAYVTPAGTVMCFDDGNVRPGGVHYSRAVEMSLDTAKMVATIVWQYEDDFYSQIFGSSYVLPGDTVLVDDGCEVQSRSGASYDPNNLKSARVMEVTHATPPVKVAEVDISVPLGGFAPDPTYSGFGVYRAIKIPSLY